MTYLNYTSDQFTGLGGLVIPGTIRDSVYVLEALLEQESGLTPTEIMSDSGSYSDLLFGLFWCLGYQFSPRLAELKEARFWRMDPTADYGPLNGLARHRINTRLISTHWDDILRAAGSLKVGTVHASTLVQALQRGGRPTTLGRAIAELGRIPKTLHLLNYIDDEYYRRRIQTQLNRGEDRHSVARHVFHGQRGELRQRYRQGQEDQLGALGLVVNMIVLWNTWYMQDILGSWTLSVCPRKGSSLHSMSCSFHKAISSWTQYVGDIFDASASHSTKSDEFGSSRKPRSFMYSETSP